MVKSLQSISTMASVEWEFQLAFYIGGRIGGCSSALVHPARIVMSCITIAEAGTL